MCNVPVLLWLILLLEVPFERGTCHFNLCFTEEEAEAQTRSEFAWEHSASEWTAQLLTLHPWPQASRS